MAPRKILLIRFSSLGDVVLTAPAIAALHATFPHDELHLLTKKTYAPLWQADPRVKTRFFDPQEAHFGLPGFIRFLRELAAEHYDWVVDLHALPKTRALTAWLGRPTVRYDKAAWQRRRYVITHRPPREVVHVARRYVRALAPLGVNPDFPIRPEIAVSSRARERVGGMVQAVGVRGRTLVALAPGAQWETKQWGWDRYAMIAERLNARGHWVALVGGKEDRDRCEIIAAGRRVLNFAGLLDLPETMALMDFCRLVVSNDSGPMHMAAARGAAVIGLFGSTTRELGFWPLAEEASVLAVGALPCRPCSTHGRKRCPAGHFRCMRDLTVDRVWAEVEKYLGPAPLASPTHGDETGIFYLGDN